MRSDAGVDCGPAADAGAQMRPRRLPRLVVRSGLVGFVLLLGIVGIGAWMAHSYASEQGVVAATSLGPAAFVAVFVGIYLATVLAHEAGHGIALIVLGLPWDRLTIGLGASVNSFASRTQRQQLLISFAGPATHCTVGVGLLVLAGGPKWSLLGMLGMLSVVEGAVNALVPFPRNSDGRKAWRALWFVLRGHGGRAVEALRYMTQDNPVRVMSGRFAR